MQPEAPIITEGRQLVHNTHNSQQSNTTASFTWIHALLRKRKCKERKRKKWWENHNSDWRCVCVSVFVVCDISYFWLSNINKNLYISLWLSHLLFHPPYHHDQLEFYLPSRLLKMRLNCMIMGRWMGVLVYKNVWCKTTRSPCGVGSVINHSFMFIRKQKKEKERRTEVINGFYCCHNGNTITASLKTQRFWRKIKTVKQHNAYIIEFLEIVCGVPLIPNWFLCFLSFVLCNWHAMV